MTRDPHDDDAITPEEEAVRALLGALPEPAMPDDVVARVDAALAADPVASPEAPPIDLHAHRTRRGHGTRLLQVAAVVVLLLIGGVAVVGGLDVRETDAPAGTAAADSPRAPVDVTRSGTAYDTGDLGADVRSLVAAGTQAAEPQASLNGPEGSTYDADDLAALADEYRTNSGSAPELQLSSAGGAADAAGLLRDDARLSACLQTLTGRDDQQPLALDVGSWKGAPAALIVLPAGDDPDRATAWVVGPTCSEADGALPLQRADVSLG